MFQNSFKLMLALAFGLSLISCGIYPRSILNNLLSESSGTNSKPEGSLLETEVVTAGTFIFSDNFVRQDGGGDGANYSWAGTTMGRQSGAFTVIFEVEAKVEADGDAGVAIGNGTDQEVNGFWWPDYGVLVRFASGKIQARRNSSYCPSAESDCTNPLVSAPDYVGYTDTDPAFPPIGDAPGKMYRFRLKIDFSNQIYSAYVTNTTDGLAEETIGIDFAFRGNWQEGPNAFNTATGLSAWSAWPDKNALGTTKGLELLPVSNFTVIGIPIN